MKRKSFLMLLTGMFAISSGALVGCNDDDDVNKKNSLSVTPASAIEFKALWFFSIFFLASSLT